MTGSQFSKHNVTQIATKLFLPCVLIALVVGIGVIFFWIYVEGVDVEEVCTLHSGSSGMVQMNTNYGENIYCDPRWFKIFVFSGFFTIIIFPVIFTILFSTAFIVRIFSARPDK